MANETIFIGNDKCLLFYDFPDGTAGKEILIFDIYIDNNIVLFKHSLYQKKNIAVVDINIMNYKLYCQYKKEFRVVEAKNIYLKDSTLHIGGLIPNIYMFRSFLSYNLQIEIYNSEIIKSILSLKLSSSLP